LRERATARDPWRSDERASLRFAKDNALSSFVAIRKTISRDNSVPFLRTFFGELT
jgi:hypothetical protein